MAKHLRANNIAYNSASRKTGTNAKNIQQIINWININNITHIVNLAAECGGIGLNKKHPAQLWSASTQISYNALEASRLCNITKYIAIGTVCSYAANCPTPFKEEYLMHYGMPEETNRGYGMAKLNGLIGAMMYNKEYNLNVSCLVPVNMYGPEDNFDLEDSHVIPGMIRKFLEAKSYGDETVTLWGDGTPTREFLYVDDCVEALVAAIDIDTGTDPINIGSGSEISMGNLAKLIANMVGYEGTIIWDTTRPNGQMRRCLDISKAKKILNFEPKITINEGLKRTINWYQTRSN